MKGKGGKAFNGLASRSSSSKLSSLMENFICSVPKEDNGGRNTPHQNGQDELDQFRIVEKAPKENFEIIDIDNKLFKQEDITEILEMDERTGSTFFVDKLLAEINNNTDRRSAITNPSKKLTNDVDFFQMSKNLSDEPLIQLDEPLLKNESSE